MRAAVLLFFAVVTYQVGVIALAELAPTFAAAALSGQAIPLELTLVNYAYWLPPLVFLGAAIVVAVRDFGRTEDRALNRER